MSDNKTREELNTYDFDTLVNLVVTLQYRLSDKEKSEQELKEELKGLRQESIELNKKMQYLIEQIAINNRRKYGRSSEKFEDINGQISFEDIDEAFAIFNQAESLFDEQGEIPDDYDEDELESPPKKKKKASKYPRKIDIDLLPKVETRSSLTQEELDEIFKDEEYKKLPDQIQYSYIYVPASISINEHHIEVYAGVKSERIVKANHPPKLLRNSLASPNIVASIYTGKYKSALPLERIADTFTSLGAHISTQDMSNWIIKTSERYLSIMWDYLKDEMLKSHIIQSDDTTLKVRKDGRAAGSESRMWVYRTGEKEKHPIVLYEYQKTREQKHPREFLDEYNGICVTDGYQVYHNIEKEITGLKIAGCWAHCRRGYDEVSKDAPKAEDNNAAERVIRPFTVGRKNWVMIDTISGAKASAIAYSLVETAKANGLNVYQYFKHLLTEIPKHMDEKDMSFCEDLLPWSRSLPLECQKNRYGK